MAGNIALISLTIIGIFSSTNAGLLFIIVFLMASFNMIISIISLSDYGKSSIPIISLILSIICFILLSVLFSISVIKNIQEESRKPREIKIAVDKLPEGVNPRINNALTEALEYWKSKDKLNFILVNDTRKASLQISWIKEFGGEYLGYAINRDLVQIGIGDSLCGGRWNMFAYPVIRRIATHEIGHVLGKNHVNDTKDIMYHNIPTIYEYEENSADILSYDLYNYYTFCTFLNSSRYTIKISSDNQLDILLLPNFKEYKKFTNDEDYLEVDECSSRKTNTFDKDCEVNHDSTLVIFTSTKLVTEYNITIQEWNGLEEFRDNFHQ